MNASELSPVCSRERRYHRYAVSLVFPESRVTRSSIATKTAAWTVSMTVAVEPIDKVASCLSRLNAPFSVSKRNTGPGCSEDPRQDPTLPFPFSRGLSRTSDCLWRSVRIMERPLPPAIPCSVYRSSRSGGYAMADKSGGRNDG